MLAKQITTQDILPLRPDDTCAQAMTMMSIYHVADLPVVEGDVLLGMISEDLVTTTDPEKKISQLHLNPSYAFVNDSEHVFEILGKLAENKTSVIPVVDKDEKYLGLIRGEELIRFYAGTFSFKEPGSIIVVKIDKSQYSLSEITRVIEMEGAQILASFLTSLEGSTDLLITIKINQQEIQTILTALERYEYEIHATFAEEEYESDLKSRYDLLMTYLNV